MLPFLKENLSIFTGKFYVFHRKTHDSSSKPKNQGINKKISIPEKSIDTSPITSTCIYSSRGLDISYTRFKSSQLQIVGHFGKERMSKMHPNLESLKRGIIEKATKIPIKKGIVRRDLEGLISSGYLAHCSHPFYEHQHTVFGILLHAISRIL